MRILHESFSLSKKAGGGVGLNRIAEMAAGERADVFSETADRMGLADAIVEKDFWVCWVLKQLFSIEIFSDRLLFKGGTSLSKIFHAINRFSEDIDFSCRLCCAGLHRVRPASYQGSRKQTRVRVSGSM